MKATILDLRYKMKDVLQALDRNEAVEVYYHGKLKGILQPVTQPQTKRAEDTEYFGMSKGDDRSVEDIMDSLRGERYNDI